MTLFLACLSFLIPAEMPALGAVRQVDPVLLATARQLEGRVAYGIYISGKRVGFEIEDTSVVLWQGALALRQVTDSDLDIRIENTRNRMVSRETSINALYGDGPVVFYKASIDEAGERVERHAVENAKGGLRLTTQRRGRTENRDIDFPKANLRDSALYLAWLKKVPAIGARLNSWSCSWDKDNVDAPVVRMVRSGLSKGTPAVFQVEERVDGAVTLVDTTPTGDAVRLRIGPMDLRIEDELKARMLERGTVDLMDAASVALNRDLGDPRTVDRLMLKVVGLEDFVPPVDSRQKVEPLGAGQWRVTLERDIARATGQPLQATERATMVSPTVAIQSADPKVIALAKKWGANEKRPAELAANLCRGVYKYLKKILGANSEDALTIIDRREGDCTEHTMLFVAVARAAGLPAREVGGLAYGQVKGKPVLAWHAWPEYHDGKQWRAVDPTWNEPEGVDGTHWKLSVGDRDSAWLNLMGKLKVEVEKVETR